MPKASRRWRFGLRTMLVVLVVACVWLGIAADRAKKQKRAVEEIRALGGTVWYDYQWDNYNERFDPNAKPWGPVWLRDVVGVDMVADVVHVDTQVPAGDPDLEHVRELTGLTHLSLDGIRISDKGLEQLKGLTRLKYLTLLSPLVTDAGLEHLRGLSNLEGLGLIDTQVTSDGVAKFEQAHPCWVWRQRSGRFEEKTP